MKIVVLIYTIISFTSAYCQPAIDSLRLLYYKERNEIRGPYLASGLAFKFYQNGEYDSAIKYYSASLAESKWTTDKLLEGTTNNALGASYQAKNLFASSISYYKAALKSFGTNGDSANILNVQTNLSAVYKDVGLYEESLDACLSVVSALEERGLTQTLAAAYNTLGTLNRRLGKFDEAIKQYRKSLKTYSTLNLKPETAVVHNNIGELLLDSNHFDSAASHLKFAAKLKGELNDAKGLSITKSNIGRVSMLKGNYSEANLQLTEALNIQRTIDDPIGIIETLNNLGELSILQNQAAKAKTYLSEAEALIHRAGTPEYLRQNLELQIKVDRMKGDFSGGMLHLEQLLVIRDSLLNVEKTKSLQAMQIRYDTEKKEQQIALLEQRELINQTQLSTNRIMIGSLTAGIILFGIIGALAYVNFRNARASKQKFEVLLSETRHRIKNNLQTLASIFNIQAAHYSDHNLVAEAKSAESRVHAMSLLHQKFYSVDLSHTLESETFIEGLVKQTVDIYGTQTPNVKLTIDCQPIRLDIDKAVALGLIIHELICNAFKYAFEGVDDPELIVTVSEQDNQLITTIKDNGPGVNNSDKNSSHGLGLVEALTDQLHGTINTVSEKGTTFIVRFPITHSWHRHMS